MRDTKPCTGVHDASCSPNYEFVFQTALRLAEPAAQPRVLDFGCGHGTLIDLARRRGRDFWGTDSYPGLWSSWADELPEAVRPYVRAMDGDRIPFPDRHFDVVVANMVFEHVPPLALDGALREIRRVLKPGGAFLAIFPVTDTWFEGHIGVYFPHHLRGWPRLQNAYLRLCYGAGFGYSRSVVRSGAEWSAWGVDLLNTSVFHHRPGTVKRVWSDTFGSPVQSLAADYMRFRLRMGEAARHAPVDALLAFVCHKRAGRVIAVRRRDEGVATSPVVAASLRL